MKLLALALVLTSAPDAGDRPLRVLGVSHGLLALDDGRTVTVDGGVWLDDPTAIARAQDLERLAAENAELRAKPPGPPPAIFISLLLLVAVAGVAGGYLLPRP